MAQSARTREELGVSGMIARFPARLYHLHSKTGGVMIRFSKLLAVSLASLCTTGGPAAAQAIEEELVLITPVARTLTDPALADFVKYAKERWNVNVRTSALAAGTPVAYGRIVEWKGRPDADIFWGGESALFDKLAEQKLLAKLDLPKDVVDAIPASIGKPKPIPLKDPKGFWIGTVLEPYGLVYHPKLFARLGVPAPKDWDDLLHPKLKGNVAQCAPTRSSSSHATYEVILQRDGDAKGWEWLRRLAGNTGIFTARSRDVPAVVARGEFAAGFAVPSYMAFEDRLAGHDIRFVAPKTAWITPEPIGILAGAKHPKAARAFIEFMLSERGQRVAMERGVFPITPKYRVQGKPGSQAEQAVEFTGGIRSYFDIEVTNIYDDEKAQARYQEVNAQFRKEIEAVADELKRK
jgi:iron(III) transport system substrate-binding protein